MRWGMVSARVAPLPASPTRAFWQTPLVAALVLAAGALAAYHNSFAVPFVFDDELAIVANPSLRNLWASLVPPPDLTGLPISGRPLVNFSFGVSYAMSGDAVWSYHVVNLLVHLAAGLALFGVVRRTLERPTIAAKFGAHAFEIALLVAALWTLHPLQTESVTYISQRAEALLGFFYLGSLWCFIRATEPGASPKWGWAAGAACALGMATKEVMVSAPLFAAIYARAFLAESWRDVWIRFRKPLLQLASTWLLLAWFVVQEGGARGVSAGFGLGVSAWTYLLTQCDAIVLYLKLSLWPHPLVLDYSTGLVRSAGDVWWQGSFLVVIFAATLWALGRRPALGCLGAWFFLILAPSSSVVPLVGQTMAEHRMYLPLAAVVVLAVISAFILFQRKGLAALALAAVVLGFATERRNADYASAISICEDTVAKRPANARAMALLADYYRRAGSLEKARAWLERSNAIEPGVPAVLNNLGTACQELGDHAAAVAHFEAAVARRPADATMLSNLGNALVLAGRVDEGIAKLEAALKLAPELDVTRANLANVLAEQARTLQADGRGAEAIARLERAVALQPRDGALHNRLGAALGRAGRVREGLEQFQAALQLNPEDASARQNAARARQLLGEK